MMDFQVTLTNRRTPWGSSIYEPDTDLVSATEMLEQAGLAGWNVTKQQVYLHDGTPVEGSFANVTEQGLIVGTGIGRTYTIHQTEQVFAFGDAMVDSGQAKWGRAGMYKGGSIVFGCMELTHLGIAVPGDEGEIKPYLLLINTFDASYPTQGILAFVRPRCVNTFQMARGTATPHRFSIRHSGGLEGKVVMAREAIGIAFKHAEESRELITALAMKKVVDKQVRDIFNKVVWPLPKHPTDDQIDRAPATAAFESYLTSDTLEGIRGTAWGAFNAVTEFVDYSTRYAGKSISTSEDVRGTSLIWGTGEQRKEKALEALLRLK